MKFGGRGRNPLVVEDGRGKHKLSQVGSVTLVQTVSRSYFSHM